MTPAPDSLQSGFRQPAAAYRPMPLWVWNGEVTEAYIEEALDQFAANGIGGVFIHARPGLMTEYLSERWFGLWAYALNECRRRGLECHVYDENSFPSGFAGGHTLAVDPEARIRSLEPGPNGGIRWGHGEVNGWTAHQPLVGLTRRRTAETFIRVTHEEYARRFNEVAGQDWKYCFTDEPSIDCAGGLYATADLLQAFGEEHGYALLDKLDDFLSEDPGRAWPVRFDYWHTAHHLFSQHFCRTLHDWCEDRQLAFTGHFDEHTWPSPLSVPDSMAAQRWMQTPGIDLLGFQFNPDDPDANALYSMTIREVVSVARQLRRRRVLCECYGGGGYGYTLDAAKALSVTLLGHGVNLLNPHLSMETVAGSRKYDWGQTFSDHAPWWPFYRELAEHDSRASYLLAHSVSCARVLVLQPTLSGWLHGVPRMFREACDLQGEEHSIERLRGAHTAFLDRLARHRVDFELGDEFILAELGTVDGDILRVGAAEYDCVILPPLMETILESTQTLLHRFLEGGGRVLSTSAPPATVQGRCDPRPARWTEQAGWMQTESVEALISAIHRLRPPMLRAPDGLIMHERRTEDGRALFVLANPGPELLSGDVVIRKDIALNAWDPATGEIHGVLAEGESGGVRVPLKLPARSLMFWIETDHVAPACVPSPRRRDPVPLRDPAIQRLSDNVLVLPVCSLDLGGESYPHLTTAAANNRMWKAHGFPQDPWEWTIQYKREYLDHVFDLHSGYAVEYEFTIDPEDWAVLRSTLQLAVERPWLSRIEINDAPCSFEKGHRWMDENIRAMPVGELVCAGRNRVRLITQPMNIHAEIAPIFIRGDFNVNSDSRGLCLTKPGPLAFGSWKTQGLPFYPWDVRYTWTFDVPDACGGLQLDLNAWQGSAARIMIDGKVAGQLTARPWGLSLIGALTAGRHTLTIDVYGNADNLFGPYFRRGLPIPWTWLDGPGQHPTLEDFAGLRHYGVMEAPALYVLHRRPDEEECTR